MAALANIPLYDASTYVSELYYSQAGPLEEVNWNTTVQCVALPIPSPSLLLFPIVSLVRIGE